MPAHACLRHVPCDRLGYYLFGYGKQSHLHLMNLMVFKSQSPNVSASCHDAFVDLNQRERIQRQPYLSKPSLMEGLTEEQ